MKLTLDYIKISDIQWAEQTRIDNHVLYLCKQELIDAIEDPAFSLVDLELARPGESVRIIPVKDVIEPRIKVDTNSFFPGMLDGFKKVGEGHTRVLQGCCVVTTGNIVCYQEGIIDMSGPGAQLNPFGKTNNVVLIVDPAEGLLPEQHEAAVRMAGIKLATTIAKASLSVQVDASEDFELAPVSPDLPKIVYVNLLLAQGLLHDNYLYGEDAKKLQTMVLHPNELLDGAVVSGNCVTASDKNTTYDQVNNPIIRELYHRHGKDLNFCGVIVSPISTMLSGKERGAMSIANVARVMGAQVLVVSEEGGGNPEADIMMIAERAETCGLKTVLMLHETAGERGDSEPLVNSSSYANAVITAGNKHEYILLPAMERVLGRPEALESLAGYGNFPAHEDGSIYVRMAVIIDAVSNLGSGTRSGITY